MSGSSTHSRRRRGMGALVALAMFASVLGTTILGAEIAGADTAPVAPEIPPTVSADLLPTVQIDNGVVWDQVIVGNTVYATGDFTRVRPFGAAQGQNLTTRNNLLAYNLTTGNLITTWAPSLDAEGKSIAASADGSVIYVGGNFRNANNTTRNRVAAFNATTGALLPFNPNSNFRVNDVAVSGSTVYIAGAFTAMGNQTRNRLAAVNATTGAVLPWAPNADREVRTLVAPAGSGKVVVGGHFTTMNGVDQKGMTALDGVSGAVMPWPVNQILVNYGADAAIWSLDTDGTNVYGVGYGYLVNNDPTTNGNLEGTFAADVATGNLQWVTGCRGDHYDVGAAGSAVYDVSHTHDCTNSGGNPQTEPWTFQYANAWSKTQSGTNGPGYFSGRPKPQLLHWLPTLQAGEYTGKTQAAWTIEGNGQYVVMGGEFPRVNNTNQYGLARFAVKEIAPNAQGPQGIQNSTPTLVGISPGTLRVSWAAVWDRDNQRLTYEVLRGATVGSSTVVKTLTADSNWWTLPKMSFTDTTSAPGSTQTYRIRVTDPFGNTVTSAATTGTVPGGQASDSPYRQAVLADAPSAYWRLGETAGTIGYDQVGADDLSIDSSAQRGAAGNLLNDTDAATAFTGSGAVPASTTGTPVPGPQTFSVETWFRTSSNTGGKILGFGNSRTGNSGSYDRHLYMSNNGTLQFGVYDGNTRVATSQSGLNDGQWHHVVGTMGADGLKLYVDGKLVGSNAQGNTAQFFSGYWRIGGDNIGGWPGQPSTSNFSGTIDEVAIYGGQLDLAKVRSHFLASGRAATWPTPPADSYGAAVWQNNPSLFLRLDETSGTNAVDRANGGTGANYFEGVTLGQAPSPAAASGSAVSLDSGAARVVSTTPVSNPTVFSEEVWFRTTTNDGGRIIGFGNSQNGQSNNYDRAAYMLNSGQIRYGVWTGQESTIVSPQSYNDGVWHHLVVTQQGGAQKMYVDGQLVVEGTFGTPQDYTGYWRLGSDSMWGGANTQNFRGQLDEAAIYPTALSPAAVQAHWAAAGGALPNVAPTAAFTSSVNGLTATFNAAGSSDSDGTIASYAWDFGDSTQGSGVSPSHTYSTPGTKTVTLTVTDDDGATHQVTHTVTVTQPNVAPTAAFSSSSTDLVASFDASASTDPDGTIVSYSWNFGDSTTGTGVSPTHTYATAGTRTVTLTVTDDDGATHQVSQPVTVTAPPPANVAPTASFTSSTSNLVASFNASSSVDTDGTITSYAWNFGDTTTGTGATVNHTYAAAGSYTVTLTVTDDDGATNSTTSTVTVTAAPPANVAPTAAFTSSVNGLVATLNGSTSTDSDGNVVNWSWNFGDTTTGTGATVNHTYATPGTYTVTLTVTDDDGATDVETGTVTVTAPPANVAPTASFTSSVSGLTASVDGTGSTDTDGTVVGWAWNFGDGGTGTGPTASHLYNAAGTYTVTLVVTDDDGATHQTTGTVTVTAPPAATTFARDLFGRTLASGFGSADVGGAWSVTGGNTSYSVSGGVGRISAAAGVSRRATLDSVQRTSSDVSASMSFDKPATGGGTWAAVIGRRIDAANEYRAKYKVAANGTVSLQITRMVAGVETVVQSTNVAGLTVGAGEVVKVRMQVEGTGTTQLRAKIWKSTSAEPATWNLQGTDSSAALQAPGSVGLWFYVSGSSTQVPVVMSVDDLSASTIGGDTPPPANVAPTAAFTSSVSNLAASFDAAASADSDGTIASYAWNFGDSTTGTGVAPSHTYTTPGTYTVTLTVTDDDGATDVETGSVTVTAPPASSTVAADAFGRTLVSGFGTADVGGAWTLGGGNANFSVSGGAGRISATAGASRTASLDAVQRSAVDVSTSMSFDKAQTGGGTWVALVGRRINATNDYRVKLKLAASGAVTAQLVRNIAGVETVISTTTVPGLTYSAGDVVKVRLQVEGTGTTQLRAKVWAGNAAEPASWLLQGSDTTAALQAPGAVGLWMYLSGTATTTPMVMSVDDFTASTLG